MKKILITPRSFAMKDDSPFRLLESSGYEVIKNTFGSILTKEQIIEIIQDVHGVILGVDPMDKDVIMAGKNLKAIAMYGAGTDNVDLEYAKQIGIPVSTTHGSNTNAVADYAFALIMALSRRIIDIDKQCRNRDWKKITTSDVYGKKLGLLGFGAIGKSVAKRASGFDMEVFAYDIYWDKEYAHSNNIHFATPDEIYSTCDFISLHMPLNENTANMISDRSISMMKDTAIIINTARGGLIDEEALLRALHDKKIAAAGLDVFKDEPTKIEGFYKLDNLIMGSHCSASTLGAIEAMSIRAVENILKDLESYR